MHAINPHIERLEHQISWYNKKSIFNQTWFRLLKIVEIIFAALIPFASGFRWPATLIALLGVFIVIIEGVQSLFQFHHNWITYRSTCEYLKHEKYLFLALAGPYRDAEKPTALLAERIETLVSQEHAKWISVCEKVGSVAKG